MARFFIAGLVAKQHRGQSPFFGNFFTLPRPSSLTFPELLPKAL
jgi:hypothetical protein